MNNSSRFKTRKIIILSLITAISYICSVFIKIPVSGFLDYGPKNIFIALAGLIIGSSSCFFISFIVSFFEMITISSTGIIGFFMNFLATVSFTFIASFIYLKKPSFKCLIVSLSLASFIEIIVMILFNLFISPLYLGISFNDTLYLILPLILPFNLVKCLIDSFAIVLLFNPISRVYKKFFES